MPTSSKWKQRIIVFGRSLWSAISCQRNVVNLQRTSRIFCTKIAMFSRFQVYLSITQAKQIINLLLFNHFHSAMSYPTSLKRRRRIVVYGSVARYGPQSVASATWLNGPVADEVKGKFVDALDRRNSVRRRARWRDTDAGNARTPRHGPISWIMNGTRTLAALEIAALNEPPNVFLRFPQDRSLFPSFLSSFFCFSLSDIWRGTNRRCDDISSIVRGYFFRTENYNCT